MGDEDPMETITKALEHARNVRLGRGVVSKTSYVAAALLVVWVLVLWRWSDSAPMDGGLLLVGVLATIFAVWFIRSTRSFAEKNPALALLEGAERIEWRKLEVAAQGIPSPPKTILIEDKGGGPADEGGKK